MVAEIIKILAFFVLASTTITKIDSIADDCMLVSCHVCISE